VCLVRDARGVERRLAGGYVPISEREPMLVQLVDEASGAEAAKLAAHRVNVRLELPGELRRAPGLAAIAAKHLQEALLEGPLSGQPRPTGAGLEPVEGNRTHTEPI